VQTGTVEIVDAGACFMSMPDCPPPRAGKLHDPRLQVAFLNPELRAGEAYMDGTSPSRTAPSAIS
jgi:hypothetical protein